jgi:hypothetical protein
MRHFELSTRQMVPKRQGRDQQRCYQDESDSLLWSCVISEWNQVEITGTCSIPKEGTLLLPQGRVSPARLVVEPAAGGSKHIAGGGIRTDAGEGACVIGTLFQDLGGEGALVRYRKASFVDVLRYKPSVLLQFLVMILTFVSSAISAYVTYLTNISDPSKTFAYASATFVLIIALALAVVKFVIDFRSI